AFDLERRDADPAEIWRAIEEPAGAPVTTLLDARWVYHVARGRVQIARASVPCAWQSELAAPKPAAPDESWLTQGCGRLPEVAFVALAIEAGDLASAQKMGEEWTRGGVIGRAAWE